MIMSRYRYRPVTVLGPTLPTGTVFGATLRNVTSTLPTVTGRYRSLSNFIVTSVKRVTDPNKGPFEQIFIVLLLINATLVTQVTVRFGNGQ